VIKEEEDFGDVKRDSLKIKPVPKEEELEVDIRMNEDKHHCVAREVTSFTGILISNPKCTHFSKYCVHNFFLQVILTSISHVKTVCVIYSLS